MVQVSLLPLTIQSKIASRLSKHLGVEILGSGDVSVVVSKLNTGSWRSDQIVVRVVDFVSYYQELTEKLVIVDDEFSAKCGICLPSTAEVVLLDLLDPGDAQGCG